MNGCSCIQGFVHDSSVKRCSCIRGFVHYNSVNVCSLHWGNFLSLCVSSITFGVRNNSEEEVFCTQFFFHFRVSEKRRRSIRGRPKGYRRMGKRNGYLPETPVFKGTTNVSLALRQRKWRLAIFVAVCCLDLLFATVINSFLLHTT